MKNKRKGFIVPLVILIAVLVIGAGIYYSKNKSGQLPTSNYVSTQDNASTDISGWKTYKNSKGFEVQYPSNWKVAMISGQEPVEATAVAEVFYLTLAMKDYEGYIPIDEENYISFDVAALGSDRLGSYYAPAKNLSEYVKLLAKTDANGDLIRKYIKMGIVGGQQAYVYESSGWSVSQQKDIPWQEVYWQHGNDIYEARFASTTADVANQILATFKYIK